jgi:hypothetical protein
MPVEAARSEGFSPCGVCRPDERLAEQYLRDSDDEHVMAAADAGGSDDASNDDVANDEVPNDDDDPAGGDAAPAAAAPEPEQPVVAPAAPSQSPAGGRAAGGSRTNMAPAGSAGRRRTAVESTPAERTVALPVTAPISAAPAASSASGGSRTLARGHVLVIPDRAKFHRGDCRFVRNAEDAVDLTRAQARRQGYEPCGVCTP